MRPEPRPGGWPLRIAIDDLVTETWKPIAKQMRQLEAAPGGRGGDVSGTKHLLWLDLARQISAGELVAKGCKEDEENRHQLAGYFCESATPDFDADTLRSNGKTYYWVRIFLPEQCRADSDEKAEELRGVSEPTAGIAAPGEPAAAPQTAPERSSKPPVSRAAIEEWYGRRTKSWSAPRFPSEAQDWEAAKAEFPNRSVTRDAVRALRAEAAPEEWKAGGRPKNPRENLARK